MNRDTTKLSQWAWIRLFYLGRSFHTTPTDCADYLQRFGERSTGTGGGRCYQGGCRETGTYADAVATYLAFAGSKGRSEFDSGVVGTLVRSDLRNTFARQALSMVWDYAERTHLSQYGRQRGAIGWITKSLEFPTKPIGITQQLDAAETFSDVEGSGSFRQTRPTTTTSATRTFQTSSTSGSVAV